jgi:hypothetical protein
LQWTYHNKPVYFYADDKKADDANVTGSAESGTRSKGDEMASLSRRDSAGAQLSSPDRPRQRP